MSYFSQRFVYQYIRLPIRISYTKNLFNKYLHNDNRHLKSKKSESAVQTSKYNDQLSVDVKPLGERVKETVKTTSYLSVILIGGGVTLAMFYAIFSELFSSSSPNSIYSKTLDRCINDPRVEDALGPPIKGYGTETRRNRRTRVSHAFFMKNGLKHIRMEFYLEGTREKATVHLEMREENGKFLYNYLVVQVHDLFEKQIILEHNLTNSKKSFEEETDLLNY